MGGTKKAGTGEQTPLTSFTTDAEAHLIGAMALALTEKSGEGLSRVLRSMRSLTGSMFYEPKYARIYSLAEQVALIEPFDYARWMDLIAENDLEQIFASSSGLLSTAAHLDSYVKSVRRAYYIRKTSQILARFLERDRIDWLHNLEDILGEMADAGFDGLRKLRYQSNVMTLGELLDPFLTEVKQRVDDHRNNRLPDIRTGIEQLDENLQGLKPGRLMIIAGRPSQGKTDLAINFSRNVIKSNTGVVFISIEMPARDIMTRLTSLETNVFRGNIAYGNLSDLEFNLIDGHLKKIKDVPLIISDLARIRLSDVRSIVQEAIYRINAKLVILDYIGLMITPRANSREQEIAKVSAGLKTLAREFNVTVCVLSQLSRRCEGRVPPYPELGDLRDSGAIEQDADSVLLLSRLYNHGQPVEKRLRIDIAKNRDGPTAIFEDIPYDRSTGRIGAQAAYAPAPVRYEYQADASQDNDIPPF